MCKITKKLTAATNLAGKNKINRYAGARITWRAGLLATVVLLLAGFGMLGSGAATARAQTLSTSPGPASIATTFSTKRREFRVGILLLDSTIIDDRTAANPNGTEYPKGPENPDPYIFYIADSITELKPQNWEFINPIAPATVTNAIKVRWDARVGSDCGYTVGQKMSKNMAAYWEVPLTETSLNDLLQFDLLFITNHRTTAFTPADREKLRKLVDAGGIVWMEDCGNMRVGTQNSDGTYKNDRFFLDQLQFTNGGVVGGTNSGKAGAPAIYQPTHPILNTPYQLSYDDVANLGDKNYSDFAMLRIDPATNKPGLGLPNPETLVNIVGNQAVGPGPGGQYQPYIAAGYYGSGAVIMTSGDSGCDINDYAGGTNVGPGGNSGPFCGPNIRTAHPMDLKFLYNCVAWGGANNSFRRNDRRTASTFEAVGAPLIDSFDFTGPLYASDDKVNSQSAPLIVNGMLFITGVANGQMVLRAYDPIPSRDYDGDGNGDDGRPDYSLGYGYDEVWSVNLGASVNASGPTTAYGPYEQPSAPVYGEVDAGTGGAQMGVVYVALPDGTIKGYTAFPVDSFGRLQSTSTSVIPAAAGSPVGSSSATYDYPATHGVTPSPVFYENKLFQVQPSGLVRCLSAVDGSLEWQSFVGTSPPSGATIVPAGTPTLGLSRLAADVTLTRNPTAGTPSASTSLANNSLGATNDAMLYFPSATTANGATSATGQLYAYWLGTRNEVQHGFANDQYGQTGLMNTRISGGTGTPGAFVYGMAAGPATSTAPYTFLKPRVRVFSPTHTLQSDGTYAVTATALDHYELGQESTDYSGTVEISGTTSLPTGRVQITALNSNVRTPGPKPWTSDAAGGGNEPDIVIAIDYDVTYITPAQPAGPTNYSQNASQIGARFNPNLTIPNYDPGISGASETLDTLSFTPLDTLIFGARQIIASTATPAPNPMVSLFGLHEEEGNTRLLWRFTLPHPLDTPTGISQASGQVGDVLVNDDYPINNNINFDQNWPNVDIADKPGSVTFTTTGTTASPVTIVRTVGAPIVTSDGTTYILAEGTMPQEFTVNPASGASKSDSAASVSVLMALKSEPTITLTLPVPFDKTAGVTVSQLDALTTTSSGGAPRTVQVSATSTGNNVLRLDGQRGKIQILNFNAGSGQFSASQSFVVSATPIGEAAPRRFIISPKPDALFGTSATLASTATLQQTTQTVAIGGGFTPILWYYVLLGQPQSAPTLIGDYIFFTLKNQTGTSTSAYNRNYLMGIDVDPASTDPAVRVGFSEQIANVVGKQVDPATAIVTTQATDHTKMSQVLADPTGASGLYLAPPVAAGGIMALNSSDGTFGFSDETTLIADARRVLEVGADASGQWEMAGTQGRSVIGGALPIYGKDDTLVNPGPPTPVGRTTLDTRSLSHPTTSRRIGNGDYMIADTGNNRVVRADRGGVITWTLDTLTDPFQILGGGEPTTLNGPTDVQYYLTPTMDSGSAPTKQVGYEVHYLVADAGNNRIVEVADYYNSNGQNIDAPGTATGSTAGKHVVVWATRTQSQQGRRYRFEGISRYIGTGSVSIPNPAAPGDRSQDTVKAYYGVPYVIATVSNARIAGDSSSASSDYSGGSLVSLDYVPYQTSIQVQATDGTSVPPIMPWLPGLNTVAIASNEPTGNGTIIAAADDLQLRDNNKNLVVRRLARPTYFQQLTLPGKNAGAVTSPTNPPRTVYLVCDADGVYAVYATTDSSGKPIRQVIWMFRQQEYDAINGYDDLNAAVLAGGRIAQPTVGDQPEMPKFTPSSVKMLPNGHFLITNSWTGKSALFQSGRFVGEVLEVNPNMNLITQVNAVDADPTTPTLFYAGGALSTTSTIFAGFSAPRLFQGSIAGATIPILNDQIMGNPGNTNLLEQPLFSDRQ